MLVRELLSFSAAGLFAGAGPSATSRPGPPDPTLTAGCAGDESGRHEFSGRCRHPGGPPLPPMPCATRGGEEA